MPFPFSKYAGHLNREVTFSKTNTFIHTLAHKTKAHTHTIQIYTQLKIKLDIQLHKHFVDRYHTQAINFHKCESTST